VRLGLLVGFMNGCVVDLSSELESIIISCVWYGMWASRVKGRLRDGILWSLRLLSIVDFNVSAITR
jgi:hypothetical protein